MYSNPKEGERGNEQTEGTNRKQQDGGPKSKHINNYTNCKGPKNTN